MSGEASSAIEKDISIVTTYFVSRASRRGQVLAIGFRTSLACHRFDRLGVGLIPTVWCHKEATVSTAKLWYSDPQTVSKPSFSPFLYSFPGICCGCG